MKINYSDYIKKIDVSVLVAEAIFSELVQRFPIKMISEIAETTSGGTPLRNNHEYYNGDIPWLKSGELNDSYIESSEEFITEKGLQNSSAKLLPEGTLLLAMYGATVGKTGITKIKATTNQAICALFPKGYVSQEFLFWFLKQHRYNFINISKGGAQPNISQSVINDTRIPVPNKTVQDQVVSVLDGIQENKKLDLTAIPIEFKEKVVIIFNTKSSVANFESEITQQLDLLKKLRQQILLDAVQGKLVLQDANDEPASVLLEKIKTEKEQLISEKKIKKDKLLPAIKPEEILFEIPENWVWCRLGEISSVVRGGSPRPAGDKRFYDGKISFLKVADLTADDCIYLNSYTYSIKEAGLTKTRLVDSNTLMLTNSGATLGVPKICTFQTTFNDGIAAFLGLNQVDKKFLYYFLKSKTEWYLKIASKGQGQPNLNTDIIAETLLGLPPFNEQERIVAKVEQLMNLCDELEQTIRQNQAYTMQLLQVALKEALEPGS